DPEQEKVADGTSSPAIVTIVSEIDFLHFLNQKVVELRFKEKHFNALIARLQGLDCTKGFRLLYGVMNKVVTEIQYGHMPHYSPINVHAHEAQESNKKPRTIDTLIKSLRMAFPWMLLITLFSISATATLANAALLGGGILGGVITCTNTSVAMAGTYNVIPQAKVDLVCGAGGTSLPAVIKSTQTNTAGLYTFLISSADAILLDGGNCYLNVTIPPNSCVFNVPTGVLRIPVVVLATIDALVGKVLVLVPGAVSYLLTN
ncbi:hypothetical protein Pfo_012317, partial [Paulownia fortunei]